MRAQIRIVLIAVTLALLTLLIPNVTLKLALLTLIAAGLVLGVLREGP
jgi:hypothetical protein